MLVYKPIEIKNYEQIQTAINDLLDAKFGNNETLTMISIEEVYATAPALHEFFVDNNIIPYYMVAFVRSPGVVAPIHIDNDTGDVVNFELALNLPIANCDSTQMHWYDLPISSLEYIEDTEKNERYRAYGTDPLIYKTLTPIASLELLQPYLMRIDIPHNIINDKDTYRKIISIRFNPQPVHLWNNN